MRYQDESQVQQTSTMETFEATPSDGGDEPFREGDIGEPDGTQTADPDPPVESGGGGCP